MTNKWQLGTMTEKHSKKKHQRKCPTQQQQLERRFLIKETSSQNATDISIRYNRSEARSTACASAECSDDVVSSLFTRPPTGRFRSHAIVRGSKPRPRPSTRATCQLGAPATSVSHSTKHTSCTELRTCAGGADKEVTRALVHGTSERTS